MNHAMPEDVSQMRIAALDLSRKLTAVCGDMRESIYIGTWPVERLSIRLGLADCAKKIGNMMEEVARQADDGVSTQLLDGLSQMAAQVDRIAMTIERLESQCIGLIIPVGRGLTPEGTHEAIRANLEALGNALGRPFCREYFNILFNLAATASCVMQNAVGPEEQEARMLFKASCDLIRTYRNAPDDITGDPCLIAVILSGDPLLRQQSTNYWVLGKVLWGISPGTMEELRAACGICGASITDIMCALEGPQLSRDALRELADSIRAHGETSDEIVEVYGKLRVEMGSANQLRSKLRRILLRACGARLSWLCKLSKLSWGKDEPSCAAEPPGCGLDYFLKTDSSVLGVGHMDEFRQTADPYIYTAILWVACVEGNKEFFQELWAIRHTYARDETKLSKLMCFRSRRDFALA